MQHKSLSGKLAYTIHYISTNKEPITEKVEENPQVHSKKAKMSAKTVGEAKSKN